MRWSCAVAAGDFSGETAASFVRLVSLLSSQSDLAMLTAAYEREFYYRLLQGPMAGTLLQIVHRNSRAGPLMAAADWLSEHHDEKIVISDLASRAGMSLSSFHRHFKSLTGYSPLAFQRQVRLLEARKMLEMGGGSVGSIAHRVGYQSASQFSREYKGMFGNAPVAELRRPSSV